ncbi:hypothetical protein B0H17DRAFT_1128876 [Mycena rosella]|uniref:Uncharacterized protein n=1 Tax=Mycena rosella TaxID=1033263 RepID=A0AAD7DXV9_MYCRO|nr:hypothetical protein B0H17DRAFT_1128876 [Mycena rosella]
MLHWISDGLLDPFKVWYEVQRDEGNKVAKNNETGARDGGTYRWGASDRALSASCGKIGPAEEKLWVVPRLNCIAVGCSTGVRRNRGCAKGLAKAMRRQRGGAAGCSGSLRATETGPIPGVVRWSTKRMRVLRLKACVWSESEWGWDVDLVLMPILEGSDHAEGWVWSWDAKREQAEMHVLIETDILSYFCVGTGL